LVEGRGSSVESQIARSISFRHSTLDP
jgi:hypothetical protein